MSQQRQFQMMNDTTYTKLFVGGLAWETRRETMKNYFEQFGEILEAVVITDKATGRSKGYGFVTFKYPEAAFRACQNPSPVIDGRKANCNLASFGTQKKGPTTPPHVGGGGSGRFRSGAPGLMTTPYPGSSSSTYLQQSYPQPPYSAYGYTGYSHDSMYHMNAQNYYGVYGQQFSPYYPTSGATSGGGTIGYFHNMYPYYGPYPQPQSSQAHAFGVQYPQMVQQYPFLPQHFNSSSAPILSLPTSATLPISTTGLTATSVGAIAGAESATPSLQTSTAGATFEQNPSA